MVERHNIVLVVLDGVRADHVSCYGYARETTPFLDQVAREGVRFSHVFTTAPSTLPSHASLFTGLYSVTHGATEEQPLLPARHKVLAEYLKAAGYRTAAFCTSPRVSPETGFGRGFDAFFTQRRASRLATRALLYGRKASDKLLRREDAGARRTNEVLTEWLTSAGEPFFAFVHYSEAHLPLHPPPPYDHLFVPRDVSVARVSQDVFKHLPGAMDMEGEDSSLLSGLYDGALRYVDARLREVADVLRGRGVWDRTLFLVTADHGENLGEHDMIGHEFGLYDTELRVPLVLRCPPRVPQGFVGEDLAQLTDVVPTVVRLLELDDDASTCQGRVLLERGRATQGPTFVVSERFRPDLSALRKRLSGFDTRPLDVRTKAIRTARQKFVWHSDEANELYDLTTDPGETRNLIENDAALADALRRQLFDWLAAVEKFESSVPATGIERVLQSVQEAGTAD